MDMIPGFSDDMLVKEVIKAKFKDQISLIEASGGSAEDFIEKRVENAGEQIKAEIEDAKGVFDQAQQTLIKTASLVVGLPAIMANPITIAVGQNTIQDILGNVKTIVALISSISAILTTLGLIELFKKGGSGDKLQEAAEEQASKAEEIGSTSDLFSSWKVWDENDPLWNPVYIELPDRSTRTFFAPLLPPPSSTSISSFAEELSSLDQWYTLNVDYDPTPVDTPPTGIIYDESLNEYKHLGNGLYLRFSDKIIGLLLYPSLFPQGATHYLIDLTLKGNTIPDGIDNEGNITTKPGLSALYKAILNISTPSI